MRIYHKYDIYGRTEPSIIYLARPGKKIYCALGGIETSTVSLTLNTNNTAELMFTLDKYVDEMISDGYEEIDEQMELYCDGIWFKVSEPPTITNSGMQETKEITAESYEIMLTQYILKEFKINTGDPDAYEMMYQKSHDTSKFYQVKFYDPDNEDLSLVHLILKHADVPGWKIGYVDDITPDDEGVYLPDSICNFDVDEQNVYAFLTQSVSPAHKCIFEFDTVNMLINIYRPDSLGKDTNVVLGFRNIQDNVVISREDNLVTQFYVDGLDGYNIDAVNFGDSVITDISYFMQEPYMNIALQAKCKAWLNYRESQREQFMKLSKTYNENLEILTELENRVPLDTAQNDWFSAKVEDLKTAYDENVGIIRGLEGLYVDDHGAFDLEALKKSSDWSMYESIMNYTLPSIVAALQAKGESVDGYGKGNIISNVNPVALGTDWQLIGGDVASCSTIQLEDAPSYGITRGVKFTFTGSGTAGIHQKNISVEPTQKYVLSCYAKGTGSVTLEYGNTGEERKTVAFQIPETWTRIHTAFSLTSQLIDVAFTADADCIICGMQLEMGSTPSQFGYFIQSESVMKAYETDWKLYGIKELQVKVSVYESCIEELKKNGYANDYNPLSGFEEAYFTQMHQQYLDYLKLKEEAEAALAERQAEYDAASGKDVQEARNTIAKNVLMENFGKVQSEYDGFTNEEMYIIKSLYNQNVYTNENIIVTSLDSTVDAVDKAKILYDDAVEELYIESHPQYTYSDEIENIYALPEFKEYHEQLAVNDFIRLGLDDSRYVKLRVIEITYNPCDLDESMEVTFSNMVQYKSKRIDYNQLMNDQGNQSSRGGRVSSVNKSSTSDYVITADAIKQIFSNPLFGSMLGGATTGGAGSGGTITAKKIVAELVKADEGVFGVLTADKAFIKYLDTTLVSSDKVVTKILQADKATIENLSATLIETNEISADVANIKNLLAGNAGIGNLTAIHITGKNVVFDEGVIKDLVSKNITVADLMAHNATADRIDLIRDGKASISFQNSTQQFYDANGNVRVQIGEDGNGDFNFIVRGEDGTTALFDSNGIRKDGIPDNTIVNQMVDTGAISKDKLNFKINTNEDGGMDISQIWDGTDKWGEQYTSFKNNITQQVTNITDNLEGTITERIQEVVFNDEGNAINTKITEVVKNLDGITQTVTDNKLEADKNFEAHSSSIKQNADKLEFIVTGNSESGFTITDGFISMVSKEIGIKGDLVTVDALLKVFNTAKSDGQTIIDGALIQTGTIVADAISTDAIRSKKFTDGANVYSKEGIWFDLSENGAIKAKNFAIDQNGNAYFKGDGDFSGIIRANQGVIGGPNGFHIESGKMYTSTKSSFSSGANGVYIGIDGISLGDSFSVDAEGNVIAASGSFTGEINAESGTIGGFTISSDSIIGENGGIMLSPDRLAYGNNFEVTNDGILTANEANLTNANISGTLTSVTGTIGGFTITEDSLYNGSDSLGGTGVYISPNGISCGDAFIVDSTGALTASNGTFTGVMNATDGGNIGGFQVATVADITKHMYINTLYRIINGTDGYDYQAGIKGSIESKGQNEVAFYVRRKDKTETDWSNSTLPFYVRNDGWMYCEKAIVGQSFYMTSVNYKDSGDVTTGRVRVMSAQDSRGCITMGHLTGGVELNFVNTTAGSFPTATFKGFTFDTDNSTIFSISTIDNSYVQMLPSSGSETDLGASKAPFSKLYVNSIYFKDGTSMSTVPTNSGGSGLNANTVTLRVGSSGHGNNDTFAIYSPNTDNIVVTCSTIGASPSTHTHQGYLSTSGGDVTGSFSMANNCGYNCKDTSGNNVDLISMNTSNIFKLGSSNYVTLVKGSNIRFADVYSRTLSSSPKLLTIDSSGNIGATNSSGGGGITNAAIGTVKTGTAAATVSVSGSTATFNFTIPKGETGDTGPQGPRGETGSTGPQGPAGTVNYTSIDKIYHSSSSSYYATVTSNGSSRYFGPYSSGGLNLGNGSYRWKTIFSQNAVDTGSDENIKENIKKVNSIQGIEKAYMQLNPIVYRLKNFTSEDEHDRMHFGFGARETERVLNQININTSEYGIVSKTPDIQNLTGTPEIYSLKYGEFISINTYMTQKAHHRIDSLERENQSLKDEILMLQGELSLINQRLLKLEEKVC